METTERITEPEIMVWLHELGKSGGWSEEKRVVERGQDRDELRLFRVDDGGEGRNENGETPDKNGAIFLILREGDPVRIEVETDKTLARILIEKYETVMRSQTMGRENWIELVLTGQVAAGDVRSLILQSYRLNAA